MCFSAEADLVAGSIVGLVSIDGLRHAHRHSERVLAAIPAVLSGHLIVEAFVWWGLADRVGEAQWHAALVLYLAIAFGVLPVLVPIAANGLDPAVHPRVMRAFILLGAGVSAMLMFAVVRGPITAIAEGHHIAYQVQLWNGGLLVLAYVIATCGSLLVSRQEHVRWFGAVNLAVAGLLAWLSERSFISLWCAWAALTSIAIAAHLRHEARFRGPPMLSVRA